MGNNDTAADIALPARRRTELVNVIQDGGQATVSDLCALFEVSSDTIRRDLDLLSEQGLIRRTHGGAVPVGLVKHDTPFLHRLKSHETAKRRIGAAAAAMISPGETLIVNGGSTTLAFAEELSGLNSLTVVTNNLRIPEKLPAGVVRDLYLLGGEVRTESQVTIGPVAFPGTSGITADSCVIGVGGLSVSGGLSTTLLLEASMMADMMKASKRVVILANAEKFGHDSFAHIASLDKIDVLVTDAEPPEDIGQDLAENDVRVVVASVPGC